MSVYDWIETRVPGGHGSPLGQLLDVAYSEEYGADTTDQSSLNLVYLLGYQPSRSSFAIFGVSDERYHIAGGNQQLPDAIAAALPARATLGWRMTAIATNRDGTVDADASTPSGSTTVVADQVVLAIPFPVLRTLDYSQAGFDALKQTRSPSSAPAATASSSCSSTAATGTRSGPWGTSNGDSYADIGYQNTWDVTRAQAGTTGILVNYTRRQRGGGVLARHAVLQRDREPAGHGATPARSCTSSSRSSPGSPAAGTARRRSRRRAWIRTCCSSYSYWKVGQYTAFAGYEGVRQGGDPLRRRALLAGLPGLHGGRRLEGKRAALEIYHALTGQ